MLIENIHGLKTSVHHKPAYTGLVTNFRSFVATLYIYIYEVNLVKSLLNRIFKINNTRAGFHVNVMKLKYFPAKVIDRIIKDFLDNKKSSKTVATDNTELPPEARYIKLPYIGDQGENY